jgi:hypothetical protein
LEELEGQGKGCFANPATVNKNDSTHLFKP